MSLFCIRTSQKINCGVQPQGFSVYWTVGRWDIVDNDSTRGGRRTC